MKITSIRLGFATNSSSTHSIVILKDGIKASKIDYDSQDWDFGWNEFVAGTPESKKAYLAILCFFTMTREKHSIDPLIAEQVINDLLRIDLHVKIDRYGLSIDGNIDHQSVIALPSNWEGTELNWDFVKDFSDFLAREDVAILGGNDNRRGEEIHPNWNQVKQEFNDLYPILDLYQVDLVARKDEDIWVLFNRATGAKIRVNFNA